MYSTQHTHSLSTAFHTLLNILIAWVPLSILDSKYSKLEYRFPYSTRVWVRYRANTQRWVEYRVWLSILDSKYSKLEYNFPYSTQNTQSLSTTSHTRLNILIAWVQLSILYSSMSTVSGKILNDESSIEYDFPYSTQNTQSLSMTFHTRLKVLNTQYSTQVWVHVFVFVTSFCGAFCTHTYTCDTLPAATTPLTTTGTHYSHYPLGVSWYERTK